MKSLPSRLLALAGFVLLGSAAACGMSSMGADSYATGGDNPGGGGVGNSDAGGNFQAAPVDAGIGAYATEGSLLCSATHTTCAPDGVDGASSRCGDPSATTDAGAGADSDASTLACHVVLDHEDDGGLDKTATCSPAGQGKNDASCQGSADCASGYECVGSAGVCRKYCCNSDCNSGDFCDIQSETASPSVKVPVCEPVKPCTLLSDSNTCGAEQTCTVVDDNGTVSCVAVGPANVGESCDTVHCAADLACLGDLNSRKCFALCSKSAADCTTPLTCIGSAPLFKDMDIGVCQ